MATAEATSEPTRPRKDHVESGNGYAKFWLNPVSLAVSGGYDGRELRQLLEIVTQHRETMERAWHEHFGT